MAEFIPLKRYAVDRGVTIALSVVCKIKCLSTLAINHRYRKAINSGDYEEINEILDDAQIRFDGIVQTRQWENETMKTVYVANRNSYRIEKRSVAVNHCPKNGSMGMDGRYWHTREEARVDLVEYAEKQRLEVGGCIADLEEELNFISDGLGELRE